MLSGDIRRLMCYSSVPDHFLSCLLASADLAVIGSVCVCVCVWMDIVVLIGGEHSLWYTAAGWLWIERKKKQRQHVYSREQLSV